MAGLHGATAALLFLVVLVGAALSDDSVRPSLPFRDQNVDLFIVIYFIETR